MKDCCEILHEKFWYVKQRIKPYITLVNRCLSVCSCSAVEAKKTRVGRPLTTNVN